MEVTCTRCHQPLPPDSCFCPSCGLPQLVYAADESEPASEPQRWHEVARDASAVDWRAAVRVAMILALPAGLLCCGISPAGILGLFWMSAASAWAVILYVRGQKPAWITVGAGARIGLVTGIIAGFLAFSITGAALFIERFGLHQAATIDADWKVRVDESNQMTQQLMGQMGMADPTQLLAQKNFMMSPEGHAGIEAFGMVGSSIFLLMFAAAGGALGARLQARTRRPQI